MMGLTPLSVTRPVFIDVALLKAVGKAVRRPGRIHSEAK
jgi:hypothetical protein